MRGRGKKLNKGNANLMRPRVSGALDISAVSDLAALRLDAHYTSRSIPQFYKLIKEAIENEKTGGISTKSSISSTAYQNAIVDKVATFTIEELSADRHIYMTQQLLSEQGSHLYDYAKVSLWNASMIRQLKNKKPLDKDNGPWWSALLNRFIVAKLSSPLAREVLTELDENGDVISKDINGLVITNRDQKMVDLIITQIEKTPRLLSDHPYIATNNLFKESVANLSSKELLPLVEKKDQKISVLVNLTYLNHACRKDILEMKLNEFAQKLIAHPRLSANAVNKWLERLQYQGYKQNNAEVILTLREIASRPDLFKTKSSKSSLSRANDVLIKTAARLYKLDKIRLDKSEYEVHDDLIFDTVKRFSMLPPWDDRSVGRLANNAQILFPNNPERLIEFLITHPQTTTHRQTKLEVVLGRYRRKALRDLNKNK